MYNLLHFPSCRRCLPQLITMFRGDDSAKIKSVLHSLNQKTNTVAKQRSAIPYGAAAISIVSLVRLLLVVIPQMDVLF